MNKVPKLMITKKKLRALNNEVELEREFKLTKDDIKDSNVLTGSEIIKLDEDGLLAY